MKLLQQEPICAIATPSGMGAVAIIRASGNNVIAICNKIFKAKNPVKHLFNVPSHTLILGTLYNHKTPLDEVLITVFKNPHSYTGEDIVEIHCHGSVFIQKKVIQLLHKQGIRLAKEGEFTLRAYLNKKIDLSQAEAIADVIASENEGAHQIAINQMRGGFTHTLKQLRQQLIEFTALIELELDFSQEDVEFANRTQFLQLLNHIEKVLKELITSFSYGNVIKKGVPVAIAGKPNAGKSSLLNALFNEDKAIVSDIAGTTRDTIEDTLTLNGISFRFIDTAGLRDTQDTIEALGVKKAKEKVQKAKILLYVFDPKETTKKEVTTTLNNFYRKNLIILPLATKTDLYNIADYTAMFTHIEEELQNKISAPVCPISIKNTADIDALKQTLVTEVEKMKTPSNTIVSNSRHLQALENALHNLQNVQQGMLNNISNDFLSQDLKQTLHHISEITGDIDVDQDILGAIFGKFCIGK